QSGCSLRWDTEALSAVLERSLAAGGATSHPLFRPPSRQPPLHPVLLSEPNGRSRGYREALAELLFEGLAVPAACLEPSAALTALSFGRTGATVVDVGAGVTSVAQVQDGRVVPARLREHPFAGAALDDALAGLLARQGVELLPAAAASEPRRQSAARRLAQDMKETICWCSHVPLAEAPPSEPFMHTLPDGQELATRAGPDPLASRAKRDGRFFRLLSASCGPGAVHKRLGAKRWSWGKDRDLWVGVDVVKHKSSQSTRTVRMGSLLKGTLASLPPRRILGHSRWPRP
ncbi:unnamed protein product, partial [Prorocentrum cordatum]